MSTLTLTLKQGLNRPVDLSAVKPSALAGLSNYDIGNLALGSGTRAIPLGDVFDIAGDAGDSITIKGSSGYLDYVGAGLDSGTVTVEGSIGNYAGSGMKGGRLDIKGDAGAYLASRLSGGLVTVKGSAGEYAGGTRPGDRFGMLGGIVIVDGNVGERAGDRMRRGTIIARGSFGPAAGSRMAGGTLWTEKGFGANPGPMLRRGTLIGPAVERLLPSFSDCGSHDLNVMKILSKYMTETLGALAPKPLPPKARRYAGDLATLGKGEILLTA